MNAYTDYKTHYSPAEWNSLTPEQQAEAIAIDFQRGVRVAVKSAYTGKQFRLTFEYPHDTRLLRTQQIFTNSEVGEVRALAEDNNCAYASATRSILEYV